MTTRVAAPRARKNFSRLKHVLDLPNLIDIQKASFQWFLDEGLRETIDDVSPIEDYTGTLAVEFGEYRFGEPPTSIRECREKDLTYQAPLNMTVRFVNKETGEIRAIGDNKGSMTLKGASPEHEGEPTADRWPLTAELAERGRRFGIDPERDLRRAA